MALTYQQPSQFAAEGHVIRCHIPLEELRESQVDLISASNDATHGAGVAAQ